MKRTPTSWPGPLGQLLASMLGMRSRPRRPRTLPILAYGENCESRPTWLTAITRVSWVGLRFPVQRNLLESQPLQWQPAVSLCSQRRVSIFRQVSWTVFALLVALMLQRLSLVRLLAFVSKPPPAATVGRLAFWWISGRMLVPHLNSVRPACRLFSRSQRMLLLVRLFLGFRLQPQAQ